MITERLKFCIHSDVWIDDSCFLGLDPFQNCSSDVWRFTSFPCPNYIQWNIRSKTVNSGMNLVKKWFYATASWDWSITCDVSGQKLEQEISYTYVCICTAVIDYTPTVKLDHRNSWQWALYSLGESYKSDHTRRRQKSKQWHRLSPTVEASVINVVCVCELFYWDWKFASMHTDLCTVQINVKACWITYVAALGCYFVLYMCVLSLLRTFW